jgi:orotate phosphoribosyltransferase
MKDSRVLNIFKKCQALKEGHFLLTSGRHSAVYFEKNLVLQHPDITRKLAKQLAVKFKNKKIDIVLSPAVGAIVLGYQIASILKSKFLFTEREKGKMKLRRGFKIPKSSRVLIVEDVITTGGSAKELVSIVRLSEAKLIGVACLVDRSNNKVRFQKKKPASLLEIKVKNYNPSKCPLCKKGIKINKPGSRKIQIKTSLKK